MNKISPNVGTYALLGLLVIFTGNSQAAMYKWVDEDGNTHYTQTPPEAGVQTEEIKPPPKVDTERALQELEADQQKLQDINKQKTDDADAQVKDAKEQQVKENNCKLARDKLEKAQTLPRVYKTDAQGERVKLGEEERQAIITDAQAKIKEYCN